MNETKIANLIKVYRDGSISSTLKGNMWKGPFHLPRMQLNCWKLLEDELRRTERERDILKKALAIFSQRM